MATNYLPTREAELLIWTTNFSQRLAVDPLVYGLTLQQGVDYIGAQEAFATAYQAANESTSRTPSAIEAKNTLKQSLITLTRELVNIVQAFPGTTNQMRVDLQITVRDRDPTPVPPPTESPVIDILSVDGWVVNLRLHNGDSTKRAKPEGVKGATLFSYMADTPPVSVDDWKFEGSVTTTTTKIDFPDTTTPGTVVWVTAFWFNPTAQSGPAATPVSTKINWGGMNLPQAA